jgi:uncharacterized protein YacL (UPF0231 family)
MYAISRKSAEGREREKESIGKEKAVKMNAEEEMGNENKPAQSQNKKYKIGTKTMNLYIISCIEYLPSNLLLIPSFNALAKL